MCIMHVETTVHCTVHSYHGDVKTSGEVSAAWCYRSGRRLSKNVIYHPWHTSVCRQCAAALKVRLE